VNLKEELAPTKVKVHYLIEAMAPQKKKKRNPLCVKSISFPLPVLAVWGRERVAKRDYSIRK
jgi:hypothetical protein